MDLRNCRKCGRVYAYNGFKYCSRCRNEEEENFRKVKEYIYDHNDATIQETSDETGVSVKKIISYLREGRLELKGEHHNMILDCERCGRPIKTGRFCGKCINEMEKEFKGATKSKDKKLTYEGKDSDRMYVANRHKRKN
ncbi:TIGR03826 family flagellar region protein [Sporosalibacterium faouarense]|uniref:TIGR03826 family flagellar region protein n=1 Tax=Sporosalibacterium faouarense TaxID=516123 RepID=UPI00141C0EC3|nr:TIGR03826 family flagellar region protein [Sporosalibacterium faouarense]MTI46810.1 MerR family transcriptional regulator [Bacillota bacterium]